MKRFAVRSRELGDVSLAKSDRNAKGVELVWREAAFLGFNNERELAVLSCDASEHRGGVCDDRRHGQSPVATA